MKTYKNARIFTPHKGFQPGLFRVEDGKFHSVELGKSDPEGIDLEGATVIPGLVDVHIHGAVGADLSDGDLPGLMSMARHLASRGVTSFAPATMTLPYEKIEKALCAARTLRDHRPADCARLLGVHMEGPYFSEKKKGAQNGAYLKNPDIEGFARLCQAAPGVVRIVDVAPELPGAREFIRWAGELCTVGIAHTDCTYAQAADAIAAGARHLTHLYNAMPGIHHRRPGPIAAAAESPTVSAELICDGQHVHPAAVRLAFRIFGAQRMLLVSDGLRCLGQPDGQYELGGQQVFLKEGLARLADGTIAGSATDLYTCMRRAVGFGVPAEEAVLAATRNPARAIGMSHLVGSIAPGLLADFITCRADFSGPTVYLAGQPL